MEDAKATILRQLHTIRSGKEIEWIIDEKTNRVIIENDVDFKEMLKNENLEIIVK